MRGGGSRAGEARDVQWARWLKFRENSKKTGSNGACAWEPKGVSLGHQHPQADDLERLVRATPIFVILIAGSVVTPLAAADKSRASKANVEQQLSSQYPPAKLSRGRVTQPGSVLVIQRNGIGASPASALAYSNKFKDGQIKPGMKGALTQNVARDLRVGERVFLVKTEVKEASIVFHVQSCGACSAVEIDPEHLPYKASVSFQFPKRYLETAPFSEIQRTIAQVFNHTSPPGAAAGPQPQAPPAKIELGQTTDQVAAGLGQPDKVVKLDEKEIYVYKNLKIIFLNGKVSDVE